MFDYTPIGTRIARLTGKPNVGDKVAAEILGVSERQVRQARKRGMDEWMADRMACALGMHPSDLWPDEWIDDQALFVYDLSVGRCSPEEIPSLVDAEVWR